MKLIVALFASVLLVLNAHAAEFAFPRLCGVNNGSKEYGNIEYLNRLAKLDVVILGFYPGWRRGDWTMSKVTNYLRKQNPNILIGQYTILNEAYDYDEKFKANWDKTDAIYKNNWWLLDGGRKVQWTDEFSAYDINITSFAQKSESGLTYPQWVANRDYELYFENDDFDVWYLDNVFLNSRVDGDWDLDGSTDSSTDPRFVKAFRKAYLLEWETIRTLRPDIFLLGNTCKVDFSTTEFAGKLNGVLLEAHMGKPWSIYERSGWDAMMDIYHKAMDHTLDPKLVVFNVWDNPGNDKFFRFAFASCLLDDGFFSYTNKSKGYSSVELFPEYDIDFGNPIDTPRKEAWDSGVYRREFQNAIVYVNPTPLPFMLKVDSGFSVFAQGKYMQVGNDIILLPSNDAAFLVKKVM